MEIENIKEFLETNEEAKRFVESLADKRVTQARTKWETELPSKIEAELEQRAKIEAERQERETRLRTMLGDRLTEAKIDFDLASDFLPETFEEDDIEKIVSSVGERVEKLRQIVLKKTFGNAKPPQGGIGFGDLNEHLVTKAIDESRRRL